MRVDSYLSDIAAVLTRSQLKSRISSLTINGEEAKLSKKIGVGDIIHVEFNPPEQISISPEKIDLTILFENSDVAVIDKSQGMVVHPAHGNTSGTIAQGLLSRYLELEKEFRNTTVRPGIVHRLDKDTSGVLITAKNVRAHEYLSLQFRKRQVEKVYLAVTKGVPRASRGTICSPIARDPGNRKKFKTVQRGGKGAVTGYRVLWRGDRHAFLVLHPETGRTHQIRVHLRSIGCPVLGDPLYCRKDHALPDTGLLLHAYKLKIILPGEHEKRCFRAPLPNRFKEALVSLSTSS